MVDRGSLENRQAGEPRLGGSNPPPSVGISCRPPGAFWLKNGRVLAGMNVNVRDVAEDIQRLVRSEQTVQAGRLASSEVSLGDLIS